MADALVMPGGGYGPSTGMLLYTGDVAERRGATVHRHEWAEGFPDPREPVIEKWVRDQITPVLDRIPGTPLLIGKSLGTNGAALANERALPAIWLTPLLNLPWVVRALEGATAPFLLVGGTGDPVWDPEVARRLTPHVLEFDGADHGLYVPGPLTASIDALRALVEQADRFLEEVAWPG